MTVDPAIAAMEAAGRVYFASLKRYRETRMEKHCYNWIVNPMPVPQLTYQPKTIARAVISEKLLTKAAQVRARITEAKRKHQSHNTVVEWAMSTLNMNRGQANRYVSENWPRG